MSEAAVADRRLHPSAMAIRFIKGLPEFVVGLPALISFTTDIGVARIVPLMAGGLAVAFGAALLSWLRFRYGVGERDIVIESGIFQRQRRIIPFDRVQDIDIEQGLLARMFGTVTVRIETGGSGKDEGKLDAVDTAEAGRLRDVIRARAGDAADQRSAVEQPVLFEMALPRLLLAGLFNFSLLYLAVLAAVFENLQPLIDWDEIDPGEWLGLGDQAAGQITVTRTAAVVAVLLLLGVITGVVHTVVKNFRFRLSRAGAGLRRVRGLFTRTEIVIPLRRIQVALVRGGLVSGALGWRTLDYQTLSGDAVQTGGQTAVPFARMDEILPVLAETGHAAIPPREEFIQVSRLSIARRSARYVLPLIVAALTLSFLFPRWLLVLPLFPLAVGTAVLQWKRHRYALTKGGLFVSRGFFERRLWIMPFERFQTIIVTRSLLQRRLGLATVAVDTAGASLINHPAIVDLDAGVAEALATELLELHKDARQASKRALVQERLDQATTPEQEGVRGQAERFGVDE